MPTVLIVDDSAFSRARCRKLLIDSGFEVVEAATGYEAIEQYRSTRPDAVLLDIVMPEMDGFTALREIRGYDPLARVAIFTASGEQSNVFQAVKLGARDFVVKPYDAERLLSVIRGLVASDDVRTARIPA